jgi:hypothetical protein
MIINNHKTINFYLIIYFLQYTSVVLMCTIQKEHKIKHKVHYKYNKYNL